MDGSNYTAIKPYRFSAYYKELDSAEIPIPQYFKLLGGNVSATSHHQLDKNVGVQWFCDGGEEEEGETRKTTRTMQRSPLRRARSICKDSYSSRTSRTQRPWSTLIRPIRAGWMAMAKTAARLACIGFLVCASLSVMTCGLFFRMVGLEPLR